MYFSRGTPWGTEQRAHCAQLWECQAVRLAFQTAVSDNLSKPLSVLLVNDDTS
jgi:hypothetical protein